MHQSVCICLENRHISVSRTSNNNQSHGISEKDMKQSSIVATRLVIFIEANYNQADQQNRLSFMQTRVVSGVNPHIEYTRSPLGPLALESSSIFMIWSSQNHSRMTATLFDIFLSVFYDVVIEELEISCFSFIRIFLCFYPSVLTSSKRSKSLFDLTRTFCLYFHFRLCLLLLRRLAFCRYERSFLFRFQDGLLSSRRSVSVQCSGVSRIFWALGSFPAELFWLLGNRG